MAKQDLSPYAIAEIKKSPILKKKLLSKLQEHILQLELIYAKRHMMERDYPELDICMKWVEAERIESEKTYADLSS